MNKEFGYTGSEYSNVGEMHQPHDPLNHIAPEINEGHDEYWRDSIEYADEFHTIKASDIDNEKKHYSKNRHKKVIRKMVYAVASAVTVVSLAQVATPSEDESAITNLENALEEIVSPVVTSAPQESLLAAQTIVFSGSGILTAEAVEKEFEKYDLSENFAVIIEDGYTEIAQAAFSNNDTLVAVSIPNSVTTIGTNAFYGCDNLVIDKLSTAGRTIGSHAFQDATINEVIISETFDGYKNLGLTAFDNTNIGVVSFEPGITTIPGYSLSGCTSITDVVIPDTVTSIGVYAFWGCSNLTSVSIPDAVTTIAADAFSGCDNLVIDKLSTAGRTIGSHAFQDATINEVIISETFDGYKNLGLTAFDNTNIGVVSFEPGITMIPGYSLSGCTSITDVVIPDTVTSIGVYAFSNCINLTRVTLPSSVITIEKDVFSNCSNLTLHVSSGSVAEAYAQEEDIPYVIN